MLRPKLVERKLVAGTARTADTVDTAGSAGARVIAESQCPTEASGAAFGGPD
jgi:hypothetical protein